MPVGQLLGRAREAVPIYASGGLLVGPAAPPRQWCAARAGAGAVKIKVGRDAGGAT